MKLQTQRRAANRHTAMIRHLCRLRPSTSALARRFFSAQAVTETEADDHTSDFRQSVQAFASRYVAPHAETVDRTNSFPKDVDLWKLMGDYGLHGAVPL